MNSLVTELTVGQAAPDKHPQLGRFNIGLEEFKKFLQTFQGFLRAASFEVIQICLFIWHAVADNMETGTLARDKPIRF